jgi:hypothetical protein
MTASIEFPTDDECDEFLAENISSYYPNDMGSGELEEIRTNLKLFVFKCIEKQRAKDKPTMKPRSGPDYA